MKHCVIDEGRSRRGEVGTEFIKNCDNDICGDDRTYQFVLTGNRLVTNKGAARWQCMKTEFVAKAIAVLTNTDEDVGGRDDTLVDSEHKQAYFTKIACLSNL